MYSGLTLDVRIIEVAPGMFKDQGGRLFLKPTVYFLPLDPSLATALTHAASRLGLFPLLSKHATIHDVLPGSDIKRADMVWQYNCWGHSEFGTICKCIP
jgi:hypothetical protein